MKPLGALVAFFAIGTVAAQAHGLAEDAQATHWTLDPWIVVPLLASAALYARGLAALWARAGSGRAVLRRQAVLYAAGWLSLAGALISPLHWLGERLFTAHMIEHEVVMAVAAPLLVLARPGGALLWAFPAAARRTIGRRLRGGSVRAAWVSLTRPMTATVLHGVAIWAWHLPPLFEAALTSIAVHRLQHLSFLLTAVLFWWALLRRGHPAVAAADLFITMTHTGILGALITFAPRVMYHLQTEQAPLWGLTALEDQQLAGLLMWVPAGTVYAGAALALIAHWVRRSGRPAHAGGATRIADAYAP